MHRHETLEPAGGSSWSLDFDLLLDFCISTAELPFPSSTAGLSFMPEDSPGLDILYQLVASLHTTVGSWRISAVRHCLTCHCTLDCLGEWPGGRPGRSHTMSRWPRSVVRRSGTSYFEMAPSVSVNFHITSPLLCWAWGGAGEATNSPPHVLYMGISYCVWVVTVTLL